MLREQAQAGARAFDDVETQKHGNQESDDRWQMSENNLPQIIADNTDQIQISDVGCRMSENNLPQIIAG